MGMVWLAGVIDASRQRVRRFSRRTSFAGEARNRRMEFPCPPVDSQAASNRRPASPEVNDISIATDWRALGLQSNISGGNCAPSVCIVVNIDPRDNEGGLPVNCEVPSEGPGAKIIPPLRTRFPLPTKPDLGQANSPDELGVSFDYFLRPERKVGSLQELSEQIMKDSFEARS